MAIYTNAKAVEQGRHGLFESSRLKATTVGHLYDALLSEDVDNGVAIKIGEFTGNGLQEVEATIATTKDKIAVTANPAIVKDAFTKAQGSAVNYFTPAGTDVKAYEVVEEDIFAVASYQFTDASAKQIKVGAYVSVDGNGAWVAAASTPTTTTTGFIGKIHSISLDNLENVTMVRIMCVQNTQIA